MAMNVYIKLAELKDKLGFIQLTVESETSLPTKDSEPVLSITVTVTKSGYGSVVGDLHDGGDNLVMFSRSATGAIIEICTKVGIPFKYC